MEFLALMAIVYFFIGAGICLLICVNPNDTGILAKLNRLFYRKLPQIFSSIVRKVFGERVLNFLGGIKYYLMQTNHPIVQIFYLLIAVGGYSYLKNRFIGYTITGIFKHMPNQKVGQAHVIIANGLAMLCFWVYYKSCAVSPGQLKSSNEKKFVKKYEECYDAVLYKKNNKCKTCNLVKPARSKHCSICKMCVSKFDHHCIWIRQCVGEKNYKYFVSFLFSHAIWCLYLSIIGALSLIAYLQRIKIWDQNVRISGQIVKVDILIALQFLLMQDTLFFFLIFMCGIMGTTLLIFVCYHFYLISLGQTTNQRVKKNDQIDYMKKQISKMDKLVKSFEEDLPQIVEYRGEKLKSKDFLQYQQQCKRRLAVLEKKTQNRGFFYNLKVIFKESDNNEE